MEVEGNSPQEAENSIKDWDIMPDISKIILAKYIPDFDVPKH